MQSLSIVNHANFDDELKTENVHFFFFFTESYSRYFELFDINLTLSMSIFMKLWRAQQFFSTELNDTRRGEAWRRFEFVRVAFQIIHYDWIQSKSY